MSDTLSNGGHGTTRLIGLWRDIYDPGHWVVEIGNRWLLHFYDFSRWRRKHFYWRSYFIDRALNLKDDEPEFRLVCGV